MVVSSAHSQPLGLREAHSAISIRDTQYILQPRSATRTAPSPLYAGGFLPRINAEAEPANKGSGHVLAATGTDGRAPVMAERAGFEPAVALTTRAFQARSFGHSDTSPKLIKVLTKQHINSIHSFLRRRRIRQSAPGWHAADKRAHSATLTPLLNTKLSLQYLVSQAVVRNFLLWVSDRRLDDTTHENPSRTGLQESLSGDGFLPGLILLKIPQYPRYTM